MTQNFFFDKFFREIANVFIEYFVVVTPIYSLIIIFITARMYHTERVNTSSTDKKGTNICKFVTIMSYAYLIMSLVVAAYARFDEKLNVLYVYTSTTTELFNISLDCFKLYFIIITNAVIVIALTTYKNQSLDRGYYDFEQIALTCNDQESFKYSPTRNPDFLFMTLLFTLHLILHFLFITDNFIVFFILFETSIIPVFIIIGFFGKRSLKFKAMYYILYFTLVSAIPMLLSIMFLYNEVGTFDIPKIQHHLYLYDVTKYDKTTLTLLFFGFFIPFAAKLAIFPFHTWLPEAHVESSTEGSIILSGIMLKLGFYGITKFCIATFSWIIADVTPVILTFAVIGAITTTFSMYKQLDIKKIIAYSSVVHMNIALCGFFSFSTTSLTGGLLFSFSHAITSAGLFCAVGYLNDKLKTRNLLEISGLWSVMPKWSFCFFILVLSNAGIPGTISFVAEITLIGGLFENFPWVAWLVLLALVISSFRNFLLFTQVCMGVSPSFLNPYLIGEDEKKKIFVLKQWDLPFSGEGLILWYIVFYSVFTGLCPEFFIDLLKWTVEEKITFYGQSSL